MKAILEFNLPDDQEDFDMAVKAGAAFAALDDFMKYLRSNLKHAELNDVRYAQLEKVREVFIHLINERELGGLVS